MYKDIPDKRWPSKRRQVLLIPTYITYLSTTCCMHAESLQLCPTLCNPMNCSPPDSCVHGDSPGKNTGVDHRAFLREIFPVGASGKELACQCRRCKRCGFNPYVGKILYMRAWQPTPEFLPGKFHGQKSLAGCSAWSCKGSDTTEHTHRCILHIMHVVT